MTQYNPYPDVDCGETALGVFVLVQLMKPRLRHGNIILTDECVDTDQYNVDFGIIRSIGPAAFQYRDSGEPWPKAPWVQVGDEVRIPRYAGTQWFENENVPDKKVKFSLIRDNEVLTKVSL